MVPHRVHSMSDWGSPWWCGCGRWCRLHGSSRTGRSSPLPFHPWSCLSLSGFGPPPDGYAALPVSRRRAGKAPVVCVCVRLCCSGWLVFTSVANSASGVVCCGLVDWGLAKPPGPMGFISDVIPPWPRPGPGAKGLGEGVVGVASSFSHKTLQETNNRLWWAT